MSVARKSVIVHSVVFVWQLHTTRRAAIPVGAGDRARRRGAADGPGASQRGHRLRQGRLPRHGWLIEKAAKDFLLLSILKTVHKRAVNRVLQTLENIGLKTYQMTQIVPQSSAAKVAAA